MTPCTLGRSLGPDVYSVAREVNSLSSVPLDSGGRQLQQRGMLKVQLVFGELIAALVAAAVAETAPREIIPP